MKLDKIKDWHWRIFYSKKDINIFEFIIETKRHLGFRFIPSGFGYGNYPLFIIDFFIISLFITIPLFKNHKNITKTYGIWFYDYNEPHWLPDFLRIDFGIHYKEFDLPWHVKFFNKYYETNKIRNLKMKNINNLKTKESFKYSKKVKMNDEIIDIYYYKEIIEYKYKIFRRFINKWTKKINILVIEYNQNITISKEFYEDKPIEEMFNEFCIENNIKIIR